MTEFQMFIVGFPLILIGLFCLHKMLMNTDRKN